MTFKVAPLNSQFMLTSMLGFLISVIWVKNISLSWGIAFALVFALMFISSIVSMTHGPVGTDTEVPKSKKPKKKKK
ncbi:hypothetical protein CEE44_01955 [Candidatus Woesearchaeota archaeon B3_Woes]|nr:MAG: hypothetical protein CEE44_01955 [Candidatus Woesearchaeota archaeon B3_Woes]